MFRRRFSNCVPAAYMVILLVQTKIAVLEIFALGMLRIASFLGLFFAFEISLFPRRR